MKLNHILGMSAVLLMSGCVSGLAGKPAVPQEQPENSGLYAEIETAEEPLQAEPETAAVPEPPPREDPEKKPEPVISAIPADSAAGPPPETAAAPRAPAYPLGVIGAVEPVVIPPFPEAFPARMDTGAATSSLGVASMRTFERDGRKWIEFEVANPANGRRETFQRPVKRHTNIKRVLQSEPRPVIELAVEIGGEPLNGEFTLTDRSEFEYPVLIGRNLLSGLAAIDPARENTLR